MDKELARAIRKADAVVAAKPKATKKEQAKAAGVSTPTIEGARSASSGQKKPNDAVDQAPEILKLRRLMQRPEIVRWLKPKLGPPTPEGNHLTNLIAYEGEDSVRLFYNYSNVRRAIARPRAQSDLSDGGGRPQGNSKSEDGLGNKEAKLRPGRIFTGRRGPALGRAAPTPAAEKILEPLVSNEKVRKT